MNITSIDETAARFKALELAAGGSRIADPAEEVVKRAETFLKFLWPPARMGNRTPPTSGAMSE